MVAGVVVAAALLRDDVHEHRAAVGAGLAQRRLDGRLVVPVDRAEVLQAEVLEHPLRGDDVLDALLHAVERLVHRAADHRGAVQRVLAPVEEALVAAGRAQRGQVVGQAADGRRVGAGVVVDDDDEREVLVGGDVVERLPGHAAGEGTVADDRDRVPVALPLEAARLGDAVGPRQGRRGVRVLDDVVLGLGAARVAGDALPRAQPAEVVASGQQLVDVGLVPGVEDDRVARRVEDAVQGDGQLDDAEVGAEVSAGLRHGVDQEVADLLGEAGHLGGRQPLEVGGAVDGLEHTHDGDSPFRKIRPSLSAPHGHLELVRQSR